jgi:creatinine amidohydrolase
VCLVPLGVIEKHGEHLPVGVDLLQSRGLAEAATAIEPAMIFPPYYLTQIHEAKHQPGTIAIGQRVMFDLLENVCDEISRNGMKKIILFNCHGGNCHFLPYFAASMLERERDYTLYVLDIGAYWLSGTPEWKTIRESEVDGHGGEEETSLAMELYPELVRMDRVVDNGMPQGRIRHLAGLGSPIWWYADFPNHYAGDARVATREKGWLVKQYAAKRIAELIRAAKADTESPRLMREFHERARKPLENGGAK